MKQTKQWALALILSAMMGAAVARSEPLVEPERVTMLATQSQPLSVENVRAAIIAGGQSLGWTVVDDKPGVLQLKFNKQNKHEVVVQFDYDAQGYQLKYVSSINMNYADTPKGRAIHPKYNSWTANLIKAIGLVAH